MKMKGDTYNRVLWIYVIHSHYALKKLDISLQLEALFFYEKIILSY